MNLPVPECKRGCHAISPCLIFDQAALLRTQDCTSFTDIIHACDLFYKFGRGKFPLCMTQLFFLKCDKRDSPVFCKFLKPHFVFLMEMLVSFSTAWLYISASARQTLASFSITSASLFLRQPIPSVTTLGMICTVDVNGLQVG